MLDVLRRKAAARGIENVRAVAGDLATADLKPHDVVLAAWSLYRQVELLPALRRLARAARRTLVIVSGASPSPPHRPLVRAIWGGDGEAELPSHLIFAGALWQLGLFAETRLAYEDHVAAGGSPRDVARRLAPSRATDAELDRLADGLAPLLARERDSWRYAYTSPVGIVIWHRRDGEQP
jgi:hypothetical protein